jgi:hypothetical protein
MSGRCGAARDIDGSTKDAHTKLTWPGGDFATRNERAEWRVISAR